MAFRKINTQSQDLRLIQDNIDIALTPLQQIPMIGGNLLTGVALTSGKDNPIAHKLDHTPSKWIIADQDTNSTVWRISFDSRFITLRCSTSCKISLWVD